MWTSLSCTPFSAYLTCFTSFYPHPHKIWSIGFSMQLWLPTTILLLRSQPKSDICIFLSLYIPAYLCRHSAKTQITQAMTPFLLTKKWKISSCDWIKFISLLPGIITCTSCSSPQTWLNKQGDEWMTGWLLFLSWALKILITISLRSGLWVLKSTPSQTHTHMELSF